MRNFLIGLFLACMCFWPGANAKGAPPADTVVWGGPIYVSADAPKPVEAVVITGGRFVAIGSQRAAKRWIGPQTRLIDLRGAAAFPGFTDGHAHLRGIGERELELNLEGSASILELQARLKAWADAHSEGAIIGRGWIETHWPEGRMPSSADLDAIAPARPVLLIRADGHALVANSAALAQAGIHATTPDPPGGRILRDEAGHPNGIVIDRAMDLLASLRPAQSPQRAAAALEKALEVYPQAGWTGLHNMSVDWQDVIWLEARAAQAPLPLRVYNSVTPEASANLLASGKRIGIGGRVITRAIKLYADGALGSRGAALIAPYSDAPDTSGLVLFGPKDMEILRLAKESGLQMAVHAIGDRGNALVLDAFSQVLGCAGPACAPYRWRIEHAQILRPQDIGRFAQGGIIASMQPSHAISDLYFAPARLGPARLDGAYAWHSLRQARTRIVGGSDAPVERGSPLIEFYAAITRKDLQGQSGSDWHLQERLDRFEALRLFTEAPAYAAFQEADLGTIALGKIADMSVFSVDLMRAEPAEILRGRALLTLIGGQIAYQSKDW